MNIQRHLFLLCLVMLLCSINACEDGNLPCPPMQVGSYDTNNIGDPYSIEELRIIGNCLYASVSYSGGCAEHDFELRWNGVYAYSEPPMAMLALWHNDPDDPCDGIMEQELLFDMSALGISETQELLLRIEPSDSTLVYTN